MSDRLQRIADAITDPRTYIGMRAFKGDHIEWLWACDKAYMEDVKRLLFANEPLPAYMAGIHSYPHSILGDNGK